MYERSDDIKTISVHHESIAGFMTRCRSGSYEYREAKKHTLRQGYTSYLLSSAVAILGWLVHPRVSDNSHYDFNCYA
jgi:hypothetical protein